MTKQKSPRLLLRLRSRFLLSTLALTGSAFAAVSVTHDAEQPALVFAAAEIRAAAPASSDAAIELVVSASGTAEKSVPESYVITRLSPTSYRVSAPDATGAMYGGLELGEALRLGTLAQLPDRVERAPHIANRGIKFNIPLDLRTPSYSDSSDAAQANIPHMWEREFWTAFLDNMARHRYNTLSLWSLQPFPSLVKVPEFPDVALDDVWRTRVKLDGNFGGTGHNMVKPEMLADYEVVKKITIDEKIAHWRWVMQYAADRGIRIYLFTWNVFTWGAEGKHGITRDMENPATKAYYRAAVREMVKTYPLLAGFGITAGEGMPLKMDSKVKEKWLWETYGEGVRDALRDDPNRTVRMIHRFHWTAQQDIIDAWKDYPGFPATFDFSFKYSVAHMYSLVNPPFIQPLLEHLAPGLRTWLTVRNDDIYSFRWGSPDYARSYVLHMPPAEKMGGFYMGPDGYTWGRSYLERDWPADKPRPLVIEKQWYSFLLWGRLAYDPTIPNSHFEKILSAAHPGLDSATLFRATDTASQIIPQITRFFWGDIDEKWFPEACLSRPRVKGFYTIRHFVEGVTMPGSGILDIREWRKNQLSKIASAEITPPQVADALAGYAAETERLLAQLTASDRRTLGRPSDTQPITHNPSPITSSAAHLSDLRCYAHLGRYYAAKIRAACALALYDATSNPAEQATAIRELTDALAHWTAYAKLRDSLYVPALYNRVEYVDITALTEKVRADIEIARDWKPGTVATDSPKAGTEKGFKK